MSYKKFKETFGIVKIIEQVGLTDDAEYDEIIIGMMEHYIKMTQRRCDI